MDETKATPPYDSLHLLGVKELARRLRISERSVWAHAKTGLMPAPLRIGRSRRWPAAAIERWIAGGCQPVDQEGGGS